jgi:NAD(P)-dependent dehydrogenase (short-subunit alcohol dehydrogenase family)
MNSQFSSVADAAAELGGLDILVNNAASVNAYDPEESILDYASTKGAITIFTKALAKQVLLATNEASYSTGQVFGAVGGRGGPYVIAIG